MVLLASWRRVMMMGRFMRRLTVGLAVLKWRRVLLTLIVLCRVLCLCLVVLWRLWMVGKLVVRVKVVR